MKKFSEKIGITKPPVIQIEGISTELRNSLWNLIILGVESHAYPLRELCNSATLLFFRDQIDTVPYGDYDLRVWLNKKFYGLAWYQVYDFFEFLAQDRTSRTFFGGELINFVLERENSGYRLINGYFTPITNELEIKEVAEATEKTAQVGMEGAHKHLDTALSLLAKKPQPDYRNSIKESISAVASLIAILSKGDKDDFAKALEELSKKIPLHGAMKEGFKKLYGYTSDEDGIRHAILEDPNVGYDEAKFMLVTCSAFVNFLLSKAQKSGLLKKG